MRRAAHLDSNHQAIVDALEAAGVSVEFIQSAKGGLPDLLCGHQRRNTLLEVKSRDGELNAAQVKWHRNWRGQVTVVRTPLEALRAIGFEVSNQEEA